MKKQELNILISNTLMLYIMQIAGYIFPLLTFPYLARILEPNYYGMMTFINATMVYFQMLIDFGFLLSATKECSLNRHNKEKLSEIFSSVVISKTMLAILGFAILILTITFIPSFKDKKLLTILYYISITTSILMPDYLFRGIEKMNVITYISITGKIIYTISIFIFVKSANNYLIIPILIFLSNIIASVWTYKEIRKLEIRFVRCNIKKILETLKESFMFFVSRIASTAYSSSNIFVLGLTISSVSLAQYGVANTIIVTFKSLFSPIVDSIYPYILKNKEFKLIKLILLFAMPIIILGSILLYLLAKPIILILGGEQYVDAVSILRRMIPLVIITFPSYLLGFPVLGAMNKMKEANMAIVYSSIFHICGLIILLISSNLTINNVILLTIVTESIVIGMRMYYVFINRKINIEYNV